MNHKIACFILCHGRPNTCKTWHSLEKHGYTGQKYVVCDNLDATLPGYQEIFGDSVKVFDKAYGISLSDSGDNFDNHNVSMYPRNVIRDWAKEMDLDYYFVLDDDYSYYRYNVTHNFEIVRTAKTIKNLDRVFDAMVEYMHNTPQLDCLAMGQTGEMIGGVTADSVGPKRKVMNLFLFSTQRDYEFMGKLNEDVNMYVHGGWRGKLYLTTRQVMLQQNATQQGGGITDVYRTMGTYVKSFYSLLYQPSSVKVAMMSTKHSRLHHEIDWRHTVPKILNPKYSRISDRKTESDTWEKDPES